MKILTFLQSKHPMKIPIKIQFNKNYLALQFTSFYTHLHINHLHFLSHQSAFIKKQIKDRQKFLILLLVEEFKEAKIEKQSDYKIAVLDFREKSSLIIKDPIKIRLVKNNQSDCRKKLRSCYPFTSVRSTQKRQSNFIIFNFR